MPSDLHSFQLCVSPEGLLNVPGLVIKFGNVTWSALFHDRLLGEWKNAIYGLNNLRGLQELQIWLGHKHVLVPELEQRPWKENEDNQTLQQGHDQLFHMFGTAIVPNFTVHLTWNPIDLLSQWKWPFQIKLHTKDEMMDFIPDLEDDDLYDW